MFSFTLFRIPVTVGWSFVLIVALLGLTGRRDPAYVAVWIGVVFFSILIHELGHAFTARGMGAKVAIELNGLGGLTRWSVPPDNFGPGRRAMVAAAGSAVGVLFGGLVWIVALQFAPYSGLVAFTINSLIMVNLFWGLLNWLPIRPLDGGHLLESLLQKVAPQRAEPIARGVFIVTSAAALAWAIYANLIFIAVLAGWMLLAEFSAGRSSAPVAPGPPVQFGYDDQVDAPGVIDVQGEVVDIEIERPDDG